MKISILLSSIFLLSCTTQDKHAPIAFPKGGYDFPKFVEAKDSNFYCYPIKNLESPKDSFLDAFYSQRFLPLLNEPNLSIKPFPEPIFRLSYSTAIVPTYIISLTENSITVKKRERTKHVYQDNLTESERFQWDIFSRFFPIQINDMSIKESRRQYLDSLIKIYPDLINANYYRALLDKAYTVFEHIFTYSTKKISISQAEYNKLVTSINESGYWQLPFKFNCHNIPTDAGVYTLEANTITKYNIVKSVDCGDSSKYLDILRVIIKAAKINDKE